ncbi:MAG: efflux RND transporter periplasmic adaptor subunit [Pseudomonadota bacterium]
MNEPTPDTQPRTDRRTWWWIANLIISLVIIAAGIAGAAYIKNTVPKAAKRAPARFVPLVETRQLEPADQPVLIPAMGTVIPSREMALRSRVAGQVAQLHPEFLDGGVIAAGDVLIRLEDEDYRLAVAQRESAVVDAEYRLQMEMGHQDVARREWEILNDGKSAPEEDLALALRKPHLAKARADLAAAAAELAQARLNLARCVIRAPFDAVVRNKSIDLGSQVSTQDTLAELVGTDVFWVETHVRVDHLRWIDIPESNGRTGATARVRYRNGYYREGAVIRVLKDVDTEGRMARVLVAVKHPLGRSGIKAPMPPLLIGEYVRVEISGKTLAGVYSIPREALRDNEFIWIVRDDETLDIRRVTPLWRGAETVLVREGITPGERLVVSALANPAQGMALTARPEVALPSMEKTADAS